MRNKGSGYIKILIKLSWISFLLFILFYQIAAFQYPGGTYYNPGKEGFSVRENYLCDLMDDVTYQLEDNPSKLYARIALGFLCFGILLFWFYFPELFKGLTNRLKLMRVCGMAAMLVTVLLRPENHDIITLTAGFLGSFALIVAVYELFRYERLRAAYSGMILLLCFLMNFYIYETRAWIEILPMLQKFTMLLGLGWFIHLGHTIL